MFEILHKSHAPKSLFDEIAEFIDNSLDILSTLQKPYIMSRQDLLNTSHDKVNFRGIHTCTVDYIDPKRIGGWNHRKKT